jgi:uncharacterized membrane protein YphA (DoxX/SURF4 family)
MNTKTRNIINWVLAGLVAFIFIGSAMGKLTADEIGIAEAAKSGLDKTSFMFLGIVEIVSVILFLIPRTSIIGSLLLVAYMGGAIATHLEHAQPLMFPVAISVFVWIVAFIRNPELSQRIFGKN